VGGRRLIEPLGRNFRFGRGSSPSHGGAALRFNYTKRTKGNGGLDDRGYAASEPPALFR